MISKRLTSKSGITIPKDIRLQLGWQPGMSVDIEPTTDGKLLLKPHINHCRWCGAINDVHKYKDICICTECAKQLEEVI